MTTNIQRTAAIAKVAIAIVVGAAFFKWTIIAAHDMPPIWQPIPSFVTPGPVHI